jgi:SAM-dependent methyltransferase
MSPANQQQSDYWNGDEAAHWLIEEHRYDRMLAPFNGHLLEAARVTGADRVLDIGCGCGSTTRAAGRVATDGRALGIDLSEPLLRRAEEKTLEEGLTNVSFEQADAQVHPYIDSSYDAAISRFGVMFFDDPATAFANLGRAVRPGGRIAFVCWAEPVENEWIVVPGAAAAKYVALPALNDPDSRGPFSLADKERLVATLETARLVDVSIESLTETLIIGSDPAESADFLKRTGIAQALLKDADTATVGQITEAVEVALEPFEDDDGIRLGSKAWLVTARAPAHGR